MFTIGELELLLFAVRTCHIAGVDQGWRTERLNALYSLEDQLMAEIMEAEQSAALDKVGLYKTGEHYD